MKYLSGESAANDSKPVSWPGDSERGYWCFVLASPGVTATN